jgi:hypothetical protein
VKLAFRHSRPSPSSLGNRRLPRSDRGALHVSALSFSSSFSISSPPFCAHAGMPTTPVPSTIYFITRGHPRVGGIQPRHSSSARSVLKPTRPSTPTDPFNAKPCTPTLTPLSATLTKNRGRGTNSASGPCRVVLPWRPVSPVQLLNLELLSLSLSLSLRSPQVSCELLAPSLEGSTVSPVAASISPLSATFTKNPGEGGTDFSLCKLLPHLGGKASLRRYRRAKMIRWLPMEIVGAQFIAPYPDKQANQ